MARFTRFSPLGDEIIVGVTTEYMTIREYLMATSGTDTFLMPTIAVRIRDGLPLPVLRKDWDLPLDPDDTVIFVPQLQGGGGGGGGGKNPLASLLSIALVAIAPWAAAQIGGALGITTGIVAGSIAGITNVGRLILGGVLLGGSALIQSLAPMPKPQLGTVGGMADIKQASPTYNLQAQGNTARIGSPWRRVYGRNTVFGDFAEQPYSFYSGNEHILTQVLIIGMGKHTIYDTRVGLSAVGSYGKNVAYNYVYYGDAGTELLASNGNQFLTPPTPQGMVTIAVNGNILFPINTLRSEEVSGQELLAPNEADYGWVGEFVLAPRGYETGTVEVDLEGLMYYANDDSSLASKSITVELQYREIGLNDDTAIGAWTYPAQNPTQTFTAATNQPQRYTVRWSIGVAGKRYQVRMRRTDTKDESTRAGHVIKWTGLKTLSSKDTDLSGMTALIIQMRATDQLSAQANRKISSDVCGWANVYESGAWVYRADRNPIWAAIDILRASYGAKLTDAQIDIATAQAIALQANRQGEYFDFIAESSQPAGEALTRCLEVCRTIWYQRAGKIRFNRDEDKPSYALAIHDGNTIANSVSLKYVTATEDMTDGVEAEYWDNATVDWQVTNVQSPYPNPQRPAKIRLEGVTSRAQATDLAMYKARNNALRRVFLTSSHEMDGFLPEPGSKVAIALSRCRWGQQGAIDMVDGLTVTLNADMQWTDGAQHLAAFTTETGSLSTTVPVTRGATDAEIVLSYLPSAELRTLEANMPTQVIFGVQNGAITRDGFVISASPRDRHTVELVTALEASAVWEYGFTGGVVGAGSYTVPAGVTEIRIEIVAATNGEPSQDVIYMSPESGCGYLDGTPDYGEMSEVYGVAGAFVPAAAFGETSGFSETVAVTPGQVFNYYVGRGGAESIGTNHSPTSCTEMLPINGRAGADGSIRFYT